jgi:hypothetical protein
MFRLRIISKIGLKFALPLLFFQVVILAPLPDDFGLNYDVASLTKPVADNLAKCPVSRPSLDNAPVARERLDRLHMTLCGISSIEHKKQKLRQKKTPTSEGSDDQFPGPAFVLPTAHELFHNSSPHSANIFICSHNKKKLQSGFTREKPFRDQHCCSVGRSRLASRDLLESTISISVPAFNTALRASPPALIVQYFHRFDQERLGG